MTNVGAFTWYEQISPLRPAPIELRLTPNWFGTSVEMMKNHLNSNPVAGVRKYSHLARSFSFKIAPAALP